MLIDTFVKLLTTEKRDALAKKSKVPYSTIGNWVQGKAIPNLLNAEVIFNALGYDIQLVKRRNNDTRTI